MRALLIIDMQMEIQRRIDAGRDCVNADAPSKIADLSDAFRQANLPVIHVRHQDSSPASCFHKDAPGYPPMPCAKAVGQEIVFVKGTSSAFASTNLGAHLTACGITDLTVVGAVAGFCVSSTVRSGANLGFSMTVVRDAVIGFDLPDDGLSAQLIFDITMAQLASDFALMVTADAVIGEVASAFENQGEQSH